MRITKPAFVGWVDRPSIACVETSDAGFINPAYGSVSDTPPARARSVRRGGRCARRVASYDGQRYGDPVIRDFADKEAEKVWNGTPLRRLPAGMQAVARRKLRMLNNAATLDDLRIPPANRLEALKGDRKGQHSIRINDQWRVCFRWKDGDAHDVEIVDYH